MSRHGLPLALALLVLASGCQKPWRNSEDYSRTIGRLEEPNSLIESPRVAVANYGSETASAVRQAAATELDTQNPVVTVADEVHVPGEFAASVTRRLELAGNALATAMESEGDQRDTLFAQARQGYQSVLDEDPSNPAAHHRLGVIGDLQSDFVFAEEHYRAALAKKPADCDLLSDIGYSYELQGRSDVAEKFFRRALMHDPSHASAANNLGKLMAEQGDYDAAYGLFETAGGNTHADEVIGHFFPHGRPPEQSDGKEWSIAPDTNTRASLPVVRPVPRSTVVNDSLAELPADTKAQLDAVQQELDRQLGELSADARFPSDAVSNETPAALNDATALEAYPQSVAADVAQSMADSLLPSLPPDSTPLVETPSVTPEVDSDQIPAYPGQEDRGIPWRQLRVAPAYELPPEERPVANSSQPPATASVAQQPPVTPAEPKLSPTSPLPYTPNTKPSKTPESQPLLDAQPVIQRSITTAPMPTATAVSQGQASATVQPPEAIQQYPFSGVVNEPIRRSTDRPTTTLPPTVQVKEPPKLQVVRPISASERQQLKTTSPSPKPQGIQTWPGLRHSSPAVAEPANYPSANKPTARPPITPPAYRPLSRPVYEPTKPKQVTKQPTKPANHGIQFKPARQTPVRSGPSGLLPIIRPGAADGS